MDTADTERLTATLLELGLMPHEAKRFAEISHVLPRDFVRSRLTKIGRDRLAVVSPLLTENNALQLLQLAEQYPLDQLHEVIEARAPAGAPRGLRLSVWTMEMMGREFEAAGIVQDAKKALEDETALLRVIHRLTARAGAARTFLVDGEKASKVIRLVLRIESDRRWSGSDSYFLASEIETMLRDSSDALNATLAKHGQSLRAMPRITKVDAFHRGPDLPGNGARAHQMGFDLSSNPFSPGSRRYVKWEREFRNSSRFFFMP
jgi:hypothetical protein